MEDFDNETIIKNINEFKLLIITQKQYVLNTQHENTLKTLELMSSDPNKTKKLTEEEKQKRGITEQPKMLV